MTAVALVMLEVLCSAGQSCQRAERRVRQVAPLVERAARLEHVRPELLASLVAHESSARGWQRSATGAWVLRRSRAGALGLAQLMPATAGQVCRGLAWRTDALANVRCGARVLRMYDGLCGGDDTWAVGAYNSGACAPSDWSRRVVRDSQRVAVRS